MNKQIIKKLANESYIKGKLDTGRVNRIANLLKKEDLKTYINTLKKLQSQKTVSVTVPSEKSIKEVEKSLLKLYPRKKIIFKIDNSLLAGIRITDNDNFYELSINDILKKSIKNSND